MTFRVKLFRVAYVSVSKTDWLPIFLGVPISVSFWEPPLKPQMSLAEGLSSVKKSDGLLKTKDNKLALHMHEVSGSQAGV